VNDEKTERMEFLLMLRRRGIGDRRVLHAMDEVPREHFVDARSPNTPMPTVRSRSPAARPSASPTSSPT
jgi:protein-L-isoaspartate O-methyltransferase